MGIAARFGLTLAQLQAANPTVDPRFLSVNTALIIPLNGETPVSALPSPTPAALEVGALQCLASADGGLACFALAGNPGPGGLENVAAQVSLLDESGSALAVETALLPLNLLPAGQSLPLAAFFAPPLPGWSRAEIRVLSALPALELEERYLPVELAAGEFDIAPDGLSAAVSGALELADGTGPAGHVWVAAVALDAAGQVVGIRRWESAAPLAAGEILDFEFSLYSLGGRIASVMLFAEAQP